MMLSLKAVFVKETKSHNLKLSTVAGGLCVVMDGHHCRMRCRICTSLFCEIGFKGIPKKE